jgi:hypothetical protein
LHSWEDDDGTHYTGSVCYGPQLFGTMMMPDILDPTTWTAPNWEWTGDVFSGQYGLTVTGFTTDGGELAYGGAWSGSAYGGYGVIAMFDTGSIQMDRQIATGNPAQFGHFAGDCDQSTGRHYWVFEKNGNTVYILHPTPSDITGDGTCPKTTITSSSSPDVAAADGWAYVVYEYSTSGSVRCRRSSNGGTSWQSTIVTNDGAEPEVYITEDGDVVCQFIRDNKIYKSMSEDHGVTWSAPELVLDIEIDTLVDSPFVATEQGMVFDADDDELYAKVMPIMKAMIGDIELDDTFTTLTVPITGAGTEYIYNATWKIAFEGDTPLGQWLGLSGTFLEEFFRGRVLRGKQTLGTVYLDIGETEEVSSSPVFGFGHVNVVVTVTNMDEDVIGEKTEDGFVFGRRVVLYHTEE